MIVVPLLLQAVVGQPVAGAQYACTVAMPGAAPVQLAIDLRTRKPGVAALTATGDGPFSRVGAASDAVAWPVPGATAFGFATGAGQYRAELSDAVADGARLRIVALGGAQPTVAQGYCAPRQGKPLLVRNLVAMPFDATPRPARPATLRPMPLGVGNGSCRVVAPDRRTHQVGYAVTAARGNEASVAYTFDDPAWLGTAGATGAGVQFFLASPSDRLVIRTVRLDALPLVVRTSFEQSGTWIDITRNGAIVGQGECGPAIAALLVPAQGN